MVIIIGAGLSGLVSAYRLKKAGIPFKILEAKERMGGRVYTTKGSIGTPIEMGATWFGKQHKLLISLLRELNLESYKQFQGTHYFFDDKGSPYHGQHSLPPQEASYRIAGGSAQLIYSLIQQLDKDDFLINTTVKNIQFHTDHLILSTQKGKELKAHQLVLALAPKIWAQRINISPALPEKLLLAAKNTQTWMEDSIKAALEFEKPFWRKEGLPATIMSNHGPFIECYDHSTMDENKFSLCGFLNPAIKNLSSTEREVMVKQQLKSIFGDIVNEALHYEEYVWSDDPLVKYPLDTFMQPHQNNGNPLFRETFFNGKLILSGSESASNYPGYMDGAVESGENAYSIISKQYSK